MRATRWRSFATRRKSSDGRPPRPRARSSGRATSSRKRLRRLPSVMPGRSARTSTPLPFRAFRSGGSLTSTGTGTSRRPCASTRLGSGRAARAAYASPVSPARRSTATAPSRCPTGRWRSPRQQRLDEAGRWRSAVDGAVPPRRQRLGGLRASDRRRRDQLHRVVLRAVLGLNLLGHGLRARSARGGKRARSYSRSSSHTSSHPCVVRARDSTSTRSSLPWNREAIASTVSAREHRPKPYATAPRARK